MERTVLLDREWTRFIASAIAALVVAVFYVPMALAPADLNGDEAHKVSESFFSTLALRGEFDHPAWFDNPLERSNPPVGKYVYGLAMRAAGMEPPPDGTMNWVSEEDQFAPPRGREELFSRLVRPARVVSALATAVTLGTTVWLAWGNAGPFAGLLAGLLLWRHFLTPMLAVRAIFDALQGALLVLGWAIAFGGIRPTPRSTIMRGALCGILIAFAFQTRLNGILGVVAALLLLAGNRLSGRVRAAACGVMLAVCAFVSIGVNPYYWGRGNVVAHVRAQLADAHAIVGGIERDQRLGSVVAKSGYGLRVLASGFAGKIIVAGLCLAAFRWRTSNRALLAAAVANALLFVVWLPLAWARYLYPALPLLVVVAAGGIVSTVLAARWPERALGVSRSAQTGG